MAVLKSMIKASYNDIASEVATLLSKQDRVLKALDLDYRGGEGLYEVEDDLYELQLVGILEDTSDKAVNSIKRATAKALNNAHDKIASAFEKSEGVKPKITLSGVEVEESDDPDFADGIVISILFDTSVGINAKRRGVRAGKYDIGNFKGTQKALSDTLAHLQQVQRNLEYDLREIQDCKLWLARLTQFAKKAEKSDDRDSLNDYRDELIDERSRWQGLEEKYPSDAFDRVLDISRVAN